MADSIRMCRVCRHRFHKAQLQRWVHQGEWVSDNAQSLPGRGAYTCSADCAAKLPKLRQLTSR